MLEFIVMLGTYLGLGIALTVGMVLIIAAAKRVGYAIGTILTWIITKLGGLEF